MAESERYVPVQHESEIIIGGRYLLKPCAVCGGQHAFGVVGIDVRSGIDTPADRYLLERTEQDVRAYEVSPPFHGGRKFFYAPPAIREKRLFRIEPNSEQEDNPYLQKPAPVGRKKADV
jgi:hypothetical protein